MTVLGGAPGKAAGGDDDQIRITEDNEEPTEVRRARVTSDAVSEKTLHAEYVLIQMDDDQGTKLEDVVQALSGLAFGREPRAARGPAPAGTTMAMRTFVIKVWNRVDGHQVLEGQDDEGRRCSLIARNA